MKIKTPFGYTDEFQVDMILKQGTVNGPTLCCCSVGKFSDHCANNNIILSKNEIEVPPIAFVDDINGLADNTSKIVVLNAHAEVYQKRKRLNFNVEKCKILPMNTRTHSKELHSLKLNNQNISVESEVTYLAEQFNSLGNNDALIKSRVKTGRSSFAEVLGTCELFMSYESKLLLSSLLLLYHSIVMNRIIVNCQTLTRLRKKDYHDLIVCVQAGIKRMIKSPTSTPNCAIYLELGLTPIEYEIKRRKLGFLHKILNSDKQGTV